jgi:hypothetical protein
MVSDLWPAGKRTPWISMQALMETDCWTILSPTTSDLGEGEWGAPHRDILRNVLQELMQNVDLNGRFHLWFTHDGAPPYYLLTILEFWNNGYDEVDQQHGQLVCMISIPYILIFGGIFLSIFICK